MAKQCAEGANQAREANGHAEASLKVMKRLSEEANNIGAVIQTIEEITQQTNLLALNATIEAASAGEVGKGFAVVAGEIKTLSRKTQDATGTISEIIEGIRESANEADASSQKIGDLISDLHAAMEGISAGVEEMAVTGENVEENVKAVAAEAEGIANNIQEASEGSNEISRTVHNVDSLTSTSTERTKASMKDTEDLMSISRRIGDELARFKI